MKIAAAGNTEVPALLVLESKGYIVSCSEDSAAWKAMKYENEFIAESPLELLGLVEMFNERGEQWRAEDSDIDRCIDQYRGLGG